MVLSKLKISLLVGISLPSMIANAAWVGSISDDPMDDTKFGAIVGFSETATSKFGKKIQATVVCKDDGNLSIYFNWNDYVSTKDSYVTYRFDNSSPVTTTFTISTDGYSTFVRADKVEFVEQMMNGNKLLIKAKDYRGTYTRLASFSLSGFTKEYNDSCGWHKKVRDKVESKTKAFYLKSSIESYNRCLESIFENDEDFCANSSFYTGETWSWYEKNIKKKN